MKNRNRYQIIVFLSIMLLILAKNFFIKKNDKKTVFLNENHPVHKSDYSNTIIYNREGMLNYRFITKNMEYFPEQCILLITQPVLTIYGGNQQPEWCIQSDHAKIVNSTMLCLYGHVEIISSVLNSQELKKITSDHVQINLDTQDITSKDVVTLYGITFHSIGMRMRGNLRTKTAKLIEKVITLYEIRNK